MSELRLGLIGAGYWGEKLLRVFGALPAVRIAAVCDREPQRLVPLRNVMATTSAEELLSRSDIDAVLVVTPPSTHYVLAQAVLRAGKHCWIEKPMALCAREARELVQLAQHHERTLFVDETFLYDPLIRTAKEWIDRGRLGNLYHLSLERLGQGRIRRDSNVWWNSAPHDLSLLCHLVGAEVETVRIEGFDHVQPGVPDYAAGSLRLAGGISVHLYVSWLSPLKVASLSAIGSLGMLHYEGRFGARRLQRFEYRLDAAVGGEANVLPFEHFVAAECVEGGAEEPLSLAAAAFVESIRNGTVPPSAGRYSQRVVEILERAGL